MAVFVWAAPTSNQALACLILISSGLVWRRSAFIRETFLPATGGAKGFSSDALKDQVKEPASDNNANNFFKIQIEVSLTDVGLLPRWFST